MKIIRFLETPKGHPAGGGGKHGSIWQNCLSNRVLKGFLSLYLTKTLYNAGRFGNFFLSRSVTNYSKKQHLGSVSVSASRHSTKNCQIDPFLVICKGTIPKKTLEEEKFLD